MNWLTNKIAEVGDEMEKTSGPARGPSVGGAGLATPSWIAQAASSAQAGLQTQLREAAAVAAQVSSGAALEELAMREDLERKDEALRKAQETAAREQQAEECTAAPDEGAEPY